MPVMEDQLFTLEEAAGRLRVSKFTVKRYIDTGKLEGVRVGVRWLVKAEALNRYIAKNTKPEDK